jgi:ferrous iron transport protein B
VKKIKNKIKIALVGQPNVGKSTLINSISNSKLKVGNFAGATVEKTTVDFSYKDYEFEIIDLPGSYDLQGFTPDEKVTKDFLENEEYDLILNVINSNQLEKSLYLTTELFNLNKKIVIALNMTDEAEKDGIIIDDKQLSELLNVQSIKVSASEKYGIDSLLNAITNTIESEKTPPKRIYSDVIEDEIRNIIEFFKATEIELEDCNCSKRDIAIKLLKGNKKVFSKLHEHPYWVELSVLLKEAREHFYIHYSTQKIKNIFLEERISFSRGITTETVKYKKIDKMSLTQKVDSVLIHPIAGIPIFLFFMWILFQLTFELGSIPMDYIDAFFVKLGEITSNYIESPFLNSLIVDGIISGVGAVVMFLPNIVILFLGIAILETTGYMSRVAFLLDGFFHKFGLHGKSFIPLVTGFGCSIPAYMSARTLKNEKDRLVTLFIIGFMSCGARLPVYVLFISAFFEPENAGNYLFLIYLGGAVLGLIGARVLRTFVFKGKDESFVMEMPKYRMPSLYLIWHTVYSQSYMYLKKAGTFILIATILIWFASNFPKNHELISEYEQKIESTSSDTEKQNLLNELKKVELENSYLGIIGKATEPIFAPIGFDWKMTVALETGLAAKEVVVATLGVLYSLGDEVSEESESLMSNLRANISTASAIAFIVFVMLYLPCLAASIVFVKEAGSYKYFIYLFFFTTVTAYIFSFIAYRIALLF